MCGCFFTLLTLRIGWRISSSSARAVKVTDGVSWLPKYAYTPKIVSKVATGTICLKRPATRCESTTNHVNKPEQNCPRHAVMAKNYRTHGRSLVFSLNSLEDMVEDMAQPHRRHLQAACFRNVFAKASLPAVQLDQLDCREQLVQLPARPETGPDTNVLGIFEEKDLKYKGERMCVCVCVLSLVLSGSPHPLVSLDLRFVPVLVDPTQRHARERSHPDHHCSITMKGSERPSKGGGRPMKGSGR